MNANFPSPREPESAYDNRPRRSMADPDLPPDRHLMLKENLMRNLENAQRTSGRKALVLRVAAPIAVAAAAATFLLTQSPTAAGHAPVTAGHTTASTTSTARTSTVAFAVDRKADGTIKVTVHSAGAGKPDVTRLQKDLAGMGVDAKVYQGDTCQFRPARYADGSAVPKDGAYSIYTIASRDSQGDYVATIDPKRITSGAHVELAFPIDSYNTAKLAVSFGSPRSGDNDCLHD